MPGVTNITTKLSSFIPVINGSIIAITSADFCKGAKIETILRQKPAPKTIPASSGSGPTCIIADIPDLDA